MQIGDRSVAPDGREIVWMLDPWCDPAHGSWPAWVAVDAALKEGISIPERRNAMQDKYLRNDFNSVLAHAVEECGEFLAAAGKTQRWGLDSVNPELPPSEQETNEAWLRRELTDVRNAMARLEMVLDGALAAAA